jgi:polar amino acid transport system substrate-binding protein
MTSRWSTSVVLLVAIAMVLAAFVARAQQPTLRFVTQDFPPFHYEVDGKVVGPAQEMIDVACARIRARCTSTLLPWARAQKEVAEGTANGIFLVGWNKERVEILHFSPPLLKSEYGFFVSADSKLNYGDLADVQGFSVAVYGPSNTSKSLEQVRERMIERQLRPIDIDMRPTGPDGFRKLVASRVDAVFSSREVGFALAKTLGVRDKIRYAGKTEGLDYYVGFRKGSTASQPLEAFDAAIADLMRDGTGKRILDKFEMEMPEAQLDLAKTLRP